MPNQTELRAIDLVMKFERQQNRNPVDVHRQRCGYDVKSSDRFIEVKGQRTLKRADWIWISNTLVRTLGKEIANYYVYIVYDMDNAPKLKIIEPDDVFRHLTIDTLFKLPQSVIQEFGKDYPL